ncbi:MAG: molybdopterin-dependent oxidoreductase [Actinomycetota bacterium]|nr:molybdopterin-dependent oxidoreductase [Actinomycetota bacterium]
MKTAFTSGLRGERLTARLGVWIGVCFAIAFVTGLVSHELQTPHPLVLLPTRPVWGYRLTQGLHVLSGTAAIPLLLVKLWSVYPRLFDKIPWRRARPLGLALAERGSIAVLVAAAILELVSGLANSAEWYPWMFRFRPTHYALAWISVGALLVHVAVKMPVIRRALAADLEVPQPPTYAGPSRRALLRATGLASGLAVVAVAGGMVPILRKISVFSSHSGTGPAGVPINKSARAARVAPAALDPGYRLVVRYRHQVRRLSRGDLQSLPQHTQALPIACVEGWSASGTWTGVRLRDLVDLVGGPPGSAVRVVSLQPRGAYRVTEVPAQFADDPLTLLALGLNGAALALDHGYPCRLIAPNRPGVLQTKWVGEIQVLG